MYVHCVDELAVVVGANDPVVVCLVDVGVPRAVESERVSGCWDVENNARSGRFLEGRHDGVREGDAAKCHRLIGGHGCGAAGDEVREPALVRVCGELLAVRLRFDLRRGNCGAQDGKTIRPAWGATIRACGSEGE